MKRPLVRPALPRLRQLWEELHPVPPPIGHPIPRLDVSRVPVRGPMIEFVTVNGRLKVVRRSGFAKGGDGLVPTALAQHQAPGDEPSPPRPRLLTGLVLALLAVLGSGCQVLTYTGPNGERFARTALGASTAISALTVEADTNGLRRVQLQGYQTDSTQALGTVTEAAVRAALQSAK